MSVSGTEGPSPGRGRVALVALFAVYVAALAALALTGHFAFFPKEIALPILLVPPLLGGRFREFVADWIVFVGLIVLFDACRGMVYAGVAIGELPVYLGYAADADRALLGAPISVLLQDAWLGEIGAFEELLVVVHAAHFIVFLLFGMVLWQWRRESFGRFKTSLGILLYVGLLLYLVVPTVPPWLASDYGAIDPVRHVTSEVYNAAIPEIARGFDLNPIAAMPSLHMAIPVLLALIALRVFSWRGMPVVLYAAAVGLSITYLGEHYLIDLLAGGALAGIVYYAVFCSPLRSWSPRWLEPAESSKLSPLAQRLGLGAVLIAMTISLASARSELAPHWKPTAAFAERELVPRSPLGPRFLAAALLEEGRAERALEVLEELPEGRHDSYTLQLLASAYLAAGRIDEGARASAAFVERQGGSPEAVAWQVMLLHEYDVIGHREVAAAITHLERRHGASAAEEIARLRALLPPGPR